MKVCEEYVKATRYRTSRQCGRRGGHGPHGAYCNQHAKKFDGPSTPLPPGLVPIKRRDP